MPGSMPPRKATVHRQVVQSSSSSSAADDVHARSQGNDPMPASKAAAHAMLEERRLRGAVLRGYHPPQQCADYDRSLHASSGQTVLACYGTRKHCSRPSQGASFCLHTRGCRFHLHRRRVSGWVDPGGASAAQNTSCMAGDAAPAYRTRRAAPPAARTKPAFTAHCVHAKYGDTKADLLRA